MSAPHSRPRTTANDKPRKLAKGTSELAAALPKGASRQQIRAGGAVIAECSELLPRVARAQHQK
eukprot:11021018-Alexandrium_andersonii.AAC.2